MTVNPEDLPTFSVNAAGKGPFPDLARPRTGRETVRMKRPSVETLSGLADKTRPEFQLDSVLSADLVNLVSTLEYVRVKMGKAPKDRSAVLTCLAEMIDQTAQRVEKHLVSEEARNRLVAEAHALASEAQELAAQMSESAWQALAGLFRASSLTAGKKRKLYRQWLDRLLPLLDSCFLCLKARLTAPAAVSDWAQTYPMFLRELEKDLTSLKS